jgi:branched-chain amino acid transport system substrate-binding protein
MIRVNSFIAAAIAISGVTSTSHAAEPIKLGAPLALTGALADEGSKEEQGFEMCVQAVNAKGGVKVGGESRLLELVKYDYQSNTNRAIQLIQRLVTVDKVDFLMSPYGSGDTKAAAVVAERYGVPMIAPSASTETIFDQNLKNLFGILFPNHDISDAEVAYYKKAAPDVKKVAILAMNSLYPKAIAGELKKSATQNGYQVVSDEVFTGGSLDYSNVLTQIKATDPDWIYVTGYIQDLILIRRQMASVGLKAQIVTMTAGAAYPEYPANLKTMANNVTSNAWWHPSATYSDEYVFGTSQNYTQAFEAKYKKTPSYLEAAATAGCEVLAQSIEAAGTTDPAKVRDKLSKLRFDTFYGPIKFGATGQNQVGRAQILQIQDGKFVLLAPDELKQGSLKVGVGTP